MAFDKGNVSFKIFYLKNGLKEASIEKFAASRAPSIDTLGTSPIRGWVTWRHLLDSNVSEETCYFPPWFNIAMMSAEKKVPPKLLKCYCRVEEDVLMRAENLPFVNKKQKAEIKKRVYEELQPQMPPTLSGIPLVANFNTNFVLAEALTPANLDKFSQFFRETTGEQPYVVTPNGLALLRKRINANDLAPAVFTDDASIEPDVECNLGLEFLTWLWFNWEGENNGTFTSMAGDQCAYMMEGPVSFYREGKGAHEAVLRRGAPLQCPEAGIAVLCGKKMKSVKFSMSVGDLVWKCSLDSSFTIRGLKLPKDPDNEHPTFQDRMTAVDRFVNALLDLFDIFLSLRADPEAWAACEKKVQAFAHRRAEEAPLDAQPE